MARNDEGKGRIFGQGLPGTGGDIAPTDLDQDVEGHGRPEEPIGTDEPDTTTRRQPNGPQGARFLDDTDVEGHLYTGGPTTQGEFAKRAPGENPHGER
jgi:hypothetical protein